MCIILEQQKDRGGGGSSFVCLGRRSPLVVYSLSLTLTSLSSLVSVTSRQHSPVPNAQQPSESRQQRQNAPHPPPGMVFLLLEVQLDVSPLHTDPFHGSSIWLAPHFLSDRSQVPWIAAEARATYHSSRRPTAVAGDRAAVAGVVSCGRGVIVAAIGTGHALRVHAHLAPR